MQKIRLMAAAICASVARSAASAQEFPNKPVTLNCPWPADGSTDQHLRMVALEKLDQILWYRNSADYTKYALETYESERATLERLGLRRKE